MMNGNTCVTITTILKHISFESLCSKRAIRWTKCLRVVVPKIRFCLCSEQTEQEKMENDPSLVKIRIAEYDTLNELMADSSSSNELRNASHNRRIDIGQKNEHACHEKGLCCVGKKQRYMNWLFLL
ncbi:uncharacterized protein EV154DRAFT_508520 [Mucor mucedo]|uniref:uncharacterized protein n=1 Tax=Mucor mucedo TaxID=29922 RepID=UPI0022201767|nr:uncharacterized protein EV154DRAFT_508520 [Mucor mucedo]KAI7891281.1 hypothetical protein EV154DRAFT_508520 [Mucor mucedo]